MELVQMKFHKDIHNVGLHIHGLAYAAFGYHKVLKENRKLYNQVQDLKGSIRAYCRVRQFLGGQSKYLSTHRSFNFNKVFGPSVTQAEVFSNTQLLIRSVLDGYNVCIFAYGQIGSGKTYTMQNQGVNYRALDDLFLLVEQRKNTVSYDISVQMIEIYNEQVRDLLITDGLNKRYPLILVFSQTELNVPDTSLVRVTSTSDVINLMNLGQKNRVVGATTVNDHSCRSHRVGLSHRSCMYLVDLAGNERVNKSKVTRDRLKEAQHINKSLSTLAMTLMFVHISPELDVHVATIELAASYVNKNSADVEELKEQIASLKVALARKEGQAEPM
ncbi:Kinesin-like protein KIN-14I [Camellia lanceoleosa]|uniref:Kinesin-like protein KIN-14I n=1 Tax=Camellia lanceoleosa TaxID=1840588 RepID=A0ACC0FP50_9ERIC|nr:Kinesin-like protein KIN-14I [Camellia lanceoleosa]